MAMGGEISISWHYAQKYKNNKWEMMNFVAGTLLHEMVHAEFFLHRSELDQDNVTHGQEYTSHLAGIVQKVKQVHKTWYVTL